MYSLENRNAIIADVTRPIGKGLSISVRYSIYTNEISSSPASFLRQLVYVGMTPFDGWNDVGFGLDSSLAAAPGWDNATGYGVPNGVLFIASAALFARH